LRNLFLACSLAALPARAGWGQEGETGSPPSHSEQADPFEGVRPEDREPVETRRPWYTRHFSDNFTFRKELFFQLATGYDLEADPPLYSRQSAGFEILKKFSSRTATVASVNIQSRLVRRDNFVEALNDREGMDRDGFFLEYHNAYVDLYNVFNPLFGDAGRSRNLGRFNWRTGRFYLPFGINLQTDTHGTLLQLSNEQNFGFERDWYTGLYGSLTRDVSYDVYYLLGSGYYPRFRGQSGMIGARFSLGNRFLNEYGLEGGASVLKGERLLDPGMAPAHSTDPAPAPRAIVATTRIGLDGRYTRTLWGGTTAFTTELSGGRDNGNAVIGQLHQVEYTSRSRKWGWASQYRRFWRDAPLSGKAESSIVGEFTLYRRNDIGAATLQWIKFNVERRFGRWDGGRVWILNIQYYNYW